MASLKDRLEYSPRSSFVIFGMVLAGLAWYMLENPATRYQPQLDKLAGEIRVAQKRLAETEERFSNKGKFQAEMERVSQTFRLALDYLPKELDSQDLLKKVYLEARSAGVELGKFVPKDSQSKDFYDELPIEIDLKGPYNQLVGFLVNVSKTNYHPSGFML